MSVLEAPYPVFISYTHDSPEHNERVCALAQRLRSEGVDCGLDQYTPHPVQGWPEWTRQQIHQARHVLVVCTEAYRRRADGEEAPGSGLGATWEAGFIRQEIYDAQGRNEKFIPVFFSPEDDAHVPGFLRSVTRYDIGSESGYDALYARLTDQVLVPVPPLGAPRVVGARSPSRIPHPGKVSGRLRSLVYLGDARTAVFVPSERIVEEAKGIHALLVPANSTETAFLHELKQRKRHEPINLAFSDTAHRVAIEAIRRVHDPERDRWELHATPVSQTYGTKNELMVSGSGYTSDQVAELRARRILLDEKLPAELVRWGQAGALEALIGGVGASGVARSPFPRLFASFGRDPGFFQAAGRLAAIVALRLTGTVETIVQLRLRFEAPHTLHVQFQGRRRQANRDTAPAVLRVDGRCRLAEG